MSKEKTNGGGTALAVIEQGSYAILAPDSDVAELMAANLGGEQISEFDLDQVKVPGGGGTVWSVPSLDGEETVDAIEGIIVHVGKRRSYWKGKDPSGDPPDCHSRDMMKGIGDPGGPCDACPLNQFGSADNGTGKACKESRALFLVRPGDRLPIVVNVPPGSLQNVKQYMMRLPVPYFTVVTRLTLGKVKNKQGIAYAEVRPSLAGKVPADAIPMIRSYAEELKKTFG